MKGVLARLSLALALALLTAVAAITSAAAGATPPAGALYTSTNDAGGNAVLAFSRAADGTLTPAGSFATGGLGSGSGLGSQGALAVSRDGRFLFAVNAGSNDVSSFSIGAGGLTPLSKAPSDGAKPISLTVSHNLLYVLNAGNESHAANIKGFRISDGKLTPLFGSSRPLSGPAVGPAQIEFNPAGNLLVVTEKNTNKIDTYVVGTDGLPTGPNVQASAATTPFGFEFDPSGHLIVSDAFGGAAGASGLSSYSLGSNGALATITPFAPDGQTAACWVVTAKNGRYAYTTNTGSGNVSSYTIAASGSLTLLAAVAGATGGAPIDAAVAGDSRYLYTLDSGAHTISAFAIADNGSLTPLAGASGLPASAVGLAGR